MKPHLQSQILELKYKIAKRKEVLAKLLSSKGRKSETGFELDIGNATDNKEETIAVIRGEIRRLTDKLLKKLCS